MPNNNPIQTFPFDSTHIVKFRRELKKAGSLEALMMQKEAIKEKDGKKYINTYDDIEKYKTEFLIGKYATLRPFYDTEMPYVFWNDLYLIVEKMKSKSISNNKKI